MTDGIELIRPVAPEWPITCPYGKPGAMWKRGWHCGVDFGVPPGTEVKSVLKGLVQLAGYADFFGMRVWIISEHPIFGKIRHVYAHNAGLMVTEGEKVEQGQLLAFSGATGHITGPHLHFEVRDLYTDEPIPPIFPEG